IAAICVRLEGLPLALELAAARINSLPPHALLARLDNRLALLTTGASDLPYRQRTLRDTIAWSYNLLDPAEQRIFRCLSLFNGGATLEAIEAVCGQQSGDGEFGILNCVSSLIDMSLVQPLTAPSHEYISSAPRFAMLETIREYAREQLSANHELDDICSQHAAHFMATAEDAAPRLNGQDQTVWLDRLDADHPNLEAALTWSLAEANTTDLGPRLAGTLWTFWEIRGYVTEGRCWLAEAVQASELSGVIAGNRTCLANVLRGSGVLAQRQGVYPAALDYLERSATVYRELGDERGLALTLNDLGRVAQDQGDYVRARALHGDSLARARAIQDEHCQADALAGLGTIAYWLAEYEQARALLTEGLDIRRRLGNKRGIAATLQRLSYVMRHQGDLVEARATADESLSLQRELGDQSGVAYSLNTLGNVARDLGDYTIAARLLQECLELQRQVGDRQGAAYSLHQLGIVARVSGDLATASRLAEESLAIFHALQHKRGIAYALASSGSVAREQGDTATARRRLTESLEMQHELGDRRGLGNVLQEFASIAMASGTPDESASLLGTLAALREDINPSRTLSYSTQHDVILATVRSQLGQERFALRWAEGQTTTIEQIVARIRHGTETR
ncbi:MAG: tetratricopeptide repeat protein, partial [Chloroflexota bacterium]|nr:tetratricopeptide repeat protein [Chloroflexota bacterium]